MPDNHDDDILRPGPDYEFVDLDVDALIAGLSPTQRAAMDTMTERMRAADRKFAERLADLRHAMRLSQVELAQTLGISQPSVAAIERSPDPYVSTLQRYITALGATATLVVTFADHTTMTLPLEQLADRLAPQRGVDELADVLDADILPGAQLSIGRHDKLRLRAFLLDVDVLSAGNVFEERDRL